MTDVSSIMIYLWLFLLRNWYDLGQPGQYYTWHHIGLKFILKQDINSLHIEFFKKNPQPLKIFPWHRNGIGNLLSRQRHAYVSQYHACWCPGSLWSQGISRLGNDLAHLEYSIACMEGFPPADK